MARIRTIKPEFWSDEQVVECSPIARLLFVGIWNFSDDQGIHPYSVKTLKMRIFPGDDFTVDQIEGWLLELFQQGLLRSYVVENQRYLIVTGWEHQRIDKPNKRYPYPEIDQKFDDHSTTIRRPFDDHSPPEGKGLERKGIKEEKKESKQRKKTDDEIPFSEIIDSTNEILGKNFRETEKHRQTIRARWKEGYRVEDFKKVCQNMKAKWGHDPERAEYLRPITLFGTKMDGYLNAKVFLSDRGIISAQTEKGMQGVQAFLDDFDGDSSTGGDEC